MSIVLKGGSNGRSGYATVTIKAVRIVHGEVARLESCTIAMSPYHQDEVIVTVEGGVTYYLPLDTILAIKEWVSGE